MAPPRRSAGPPSSAPATPAPGSASASSITLKAISMQAAHAFHHDSWPSSPRTLRQSLRSATFSTLRAGSTRPLECVRAGGGAQSGHPRCIVRGGEAAPRSRPSRSRRPRSRHRRVRRSAGSTSRAERRARDESGRALGGRRTGACAGIARFRPPAPPRALRAACRLRRHGGLQHGIVRDSPGSSDIAGGAGELLHGARPEHR